MAETGEKYTTARSKVIEERARRKAEQAGSSPPDASDPKQTPP
jgi:hypothetical protein